MAESNIISGMDTTTPPSSRRTGSGKASPSTIPPWEVRAVSQVPYVGRSGSPPTTQMEQQTRPWPRSAREDRVSHPKPKLITANSAPSRSEYSSPVSRDSTSEQWPSHHHTKSLTTPQLAPYETSIDLPPESAFQTRTNAALALPPPSPPESLSSSSTKSNFAASTEPPAQALPGTMSSRMSRAQPPRPSKPRMASHEPGRSDGFERKPISKRFTSAFRGIFKKDPVDESQLERISDRHWTDEN